MPARLDPEVLERPLLAAWLQRIEPDRRLTYRSDVDELVTEIVRRDREGRRPGGEPRFRVAPVRLRGARNFGETLGVGGDARSDSQLSRQARLPVSCARSAIRLEGWNSRRSCGRTHPGPACRRGARLRRPPPAARWPGATGRCARRS